MGAYFVSNPQTDEVICRFIAPTLPSPKRWGHYLNCAETFQKTNTMVGTIEHEKTRISAGCRRVVRAGIEPATHGFSIHCSTY